MLRIQRKGGERVGKGNYWRVSDGERVVVVEEGVLPGDASEAYLRFHPAFMLVVGPVLGLAYAIFMPLTAIVMVLWVAVEKLFTYSASALQRAGFAWKPGQVYSATVNLGSTDDDSETGRHEKAKEPPSQPDPLEVKIHLDWSGNCSESGGRSKERTNGK